MKLKDNSTQEIDTALYQLEQRLKSNIRLTDVENSNASSAKINAVDKKLTEEVKDRQSADEKLQDNINKEIADRQEADAAIENAKQDKLIAGDNIQINGNIISATSTEYIAEAPVKVTDGKISLDTVPVNKGGTGVTTQADINKAFIGNLDVGNDNVTDGTEFVSSYASDKGFADSNALNKPYKRQFIKVWNYINNKISSVLGLTSAKVSSYDSHLTNKDNPHSVTKSQVGLGSVVNTGDSATPVSGGTTKFTTGGAFTELNKKVDKVDGKGLSSNDFTDTYKNKLDKIDTTVTADSSNLVTSGAVATAISTEVTNRNTAITNAINNLDVSSVGGDGKYISAISETDGKISATSTTMDTAPTTNSVKAVTSGGIKTAISTAETNAKNLANATGTLPVANGGTGAITAKDALNSFINSLDIGTATPVDNTYYISQDINTTSSYDRRPISALWEYIKTKISSVLGLTKDTYGGKADKATNDGNGNNIVNTYALKSDLRYTKSININKYDGSSDTWYYLIAKTPSSNSTGNIESLFVNGSDFMRRMFEGSIKTRLGNFVYNYGKDNLPIEFYKQTDGTIYVYWLVKDAYNKVALNITATMSITIYGGNLISVAPTGSKMTLTEYDYKSYGTLPIERGGTGATTAKGAQKSLLSDMQTETTPMDDTTEFVMKYGTPTDTKGALFKRSATLVWNYIKGKISSVLGLTATNYGGKAATATNADYAKNMYKQTLDLSALDKTKFYPVFCSSATNFAEVAINSPTLLAHSEYNQNRIHFDISTYGWNDEPFTLNIREYACFDNNEITIGCIGRGTENGGWAIWLRGGLTYSCFTRNCNLSLKTSDYTYDNEIYTVGTNYYGGTNTKVKVVFTPQSTITSGAYSNRAIKAPTFVGNLTGNVSGSSGSCTGNSATADKVNHALTINGQSFDGSSALNISIKEVAYDHIVYDDASLLEWANCTDGSMKKVLVKSGTYNMTKGVDFSKTGTGYVFAENGAMINSHVPIAFTASSGKSVVYSLRVVCDGAANGDNSCAFSASNVEKLILYDCSATYRIYTEIVNRSLFEHCTCYNCSYAFQNFPDSSSISIRVFYQCRCYNCTCRQTIETNSKVAISFNSASYFYKECHCASCDAELTTSRNIKAATPSFSCYYNCYDRCVGCLSTINVKSKALTVYSTLYGFLRCQYMSSCKETHTEGYSNIKGIVQCDFISSTSGINGASNTHVGNSCSIQ